MDIFNPIVQNIFIAFKENRIILWGQCCEQKITRSLFTAYSFVCAFVLFPSPLNYLAIPHAKITCIWKHISSSLVPHRFMKREPLIYVQNFFAFCNGKENRGNALCVWRSREVLFLTVLQWMLCETLVALRCDIRSTNAAMQDMISLQISCALPSSATWTKKNVFKMLKLFSIIIKWNKTTALQVL